MSSGQSSDSSAGGEEPRPSPLERLRRSIVKPVEGGGASSTSANELTVDELEAAIKTADDKERAIGFVAAPLGAAVAFIVITDLINHDPRQFLANGTANSSYTSVSLYHELFFVLLGMSVLMLVTSFLRKRLFMGIVMALYGLAIFNMHYWEFGIPFVLAGAWYLVRAYRLGQNLKLANGGVGPRRGGTARSSGSGPRSSKRYTPPTTQPRRPAKP
jgi:hypothetical protein